MAQIHISKDPPGQSTVIFNWSFNFLNQETFLSLPEIKEVVGGADKRKVPIPFLYKL